jgi:hypothetical protein
MERYEVNISRNLSLQQKWPCTDAKVNVQLRDARAKIDELLNKLTEDPKKLEKLLALIES